MGCEIAAMASARCISPASTRFHAAKSASLSMMILPPSSRTAPSSG